MKPLADRFLELPEPHSLRKEIAELIRAAEFPFEIDCGSNSCRFAKNKRGMRTNGPCHCHEFFDTPVRVNDLLRFIYRQQQTLKYLKERLDAKP